MVMKIDNNELMRLYDYIDSMAKSDIEIVIDLLDTKIMFGKYRGTILWEIPLKYLDGTVSQMPNSYFRRLSDRFVDACMSILLSECITTCLPDESMKTIIMGAESCEKVDILKDYIHLK